MDADTAVKLVSNLGLPTVLLLGFAWAVWQAIYRVTREPSDKNPNDKGGIGYQYVAHGMETTAAIRKNTEATLEVVKTMAEVLAETHGTVREIHNRGCQLAAQRQVDPKPPATG